nr:MAG TPA: hypothetical protein [Ackermannviridae sp.]
MHRIATTSSNFNCIPTVIVFTMFATPKET